MPEAAASYTFQDHSGIKLDPQSANPYQALIDACHDTPTEIQARYSTHRDTRAQDQRTKLLSPDFDGLVTDPILYGLTSDPNYVDTRDCLVYWARPTAAVQCLVADIQSRLKAVAPSIWTMPQDRLHMTVFEIAHSRTEPQISSLVAQVDHAKVLMTDYTHTHRARLIKPIIVYDAQGMALSYLPATGESLPPGRQSRDDDYTYHHLRRDMCDLARATGVEIASRYIVPSAHLTIARFINPRDYTTDTGDVDHARLTTLIEAIDDANEWLRAEYWPRPDRPHIRPGGEWLVGQEKGLDLRRGTVWYGGGETVRLGMGF